MSPSQFLPAAARNSERLHGGRNALDHDGSRNDEASDDYVSFLLDENGFLFDVESKPEIASPQIFWGKATRYIDIRHNGRFDNCDAHFDIASASGVSGVCSPADDEAGAFRAARTSGCNFLFSLSFAYSSQFVNDCNNWLNGTRSAFISGNLIAAGRKGFAQIAGESAGYEVRQDEPVDDPMLFAVRDPGYEADFPVNAFHVDPDGKDVVDDIGLRQWWVAFVSHSLISLPLELPLPSQRDRLGAAPSPAPSHQFTMVSA